MCVLAILLLVGCGTETQTPTADPDAAPSNPLAELNFDAQAAYDTRCAHCHDGSVAKAPHLIEFQLIGAKAIAATLTQGLMATHAEGLSPLQIAALATHLGGAKLADVPVRMCEETTLPASTPVTQGWSLNTAGTRFIPSDVAQLSAEEVPRLRLKWVFAYPGATRARSQPVPFGDSVLVGSQDGTVYALKLATGCAVWRYSADVEVRSALEINQAGTAAYFGDIKGGIYAIDPRDGSLLWRAHADAHPDVTITGSPRLYKQRLYVPLSSKEWSSAADPGYACCTFRGGVAAFDALTGEHLWTSYSIPQAPQATGKTNDLGAPLYHPAGAPVWNSPTIDAKRNLLYVGTGEAYTSPAADTSDSILAIDLTTGELMWHYQSIAGDAWNMACFIDQTVPKKTARIWILVRHPC